jgi:hypothetical protein
VCQGRAAFYVAHLYQEAAAMSSVQQYHRDAAMFAEGICPVCLTKVGKTRPRHSMIPHFHRHKQVNLEHALYMKSSYKQHFKPGRSSKPVRTANAEKVAELLRRHVGQHLFAELVQLNRSTSVS